MLKHSQDQNEIWKWYMKVIHGAGLGDVREWARLDLSMPQLKVLMILNYDKEVTVGQLASMMDTSLPNMTGILDRLEVQGFIERIASHEDRRVILVKLTEQSTQIFQRLIHSGFAKMSRVLNQLSDQDQKVVSQGLKLLSEALERDEIDN